MKKLSLSFALLPGFAMPLAAQTVRSWSGLNNGTWHTATNWNGGNIFAGKTALATPLTGEGAANDIMAPVAANSATNIGINLNMMTNGAGGFGLEFGAIDWNKTNTTATVIGNNSTTVGGIVRLNGATVNSQANTFIRVAGSADLTVSAANTGTPTAAQTLELQLGQTNGIFNVDTVRTLTFSMNNLTGLLPNTGWTLNGGGQFVISSPSTLTGPVSIVSGRAQAGSATAFGSGAVNVASGGQAWLTSSVANNFTIAGTGWTETAGLLGTIRYQNTSTSGSIALTAPARIGAFNGTTGTLNGPLSGSAALEINGPETNFNGTINLNGSASGLTGPLTVRQGRLNVNTASGPVGSVGIADGAALGGEGVIVGPVTLGTTTGAQIFADGSTPGVLTVDWELTVNGTATVNLTAPGPSPMRILKATAGLNATAANFTLPGGLAGYRPGSGFDTTSTPGEVLLNLITSDTTWTGATTPAWNTTDANWTGSGGKFFQGDRVTFNDTGVAAVNIPANVLPGKVTVDVTGTDRSFAGTGAIAGTTTQLVKKGAGKLTVSNVNTYSGGTSIEGGVLEVGAVDAIPSGITVSSGTLRVTPILGLAAANTITLGDAASGTSATVLEIPPATAADQTVLSTPVVLSSAAPNSKAIIRYPGSATSGGASTFNGQITLNGRDLWLENTSNSGTPVTRLWNQAGKITGAGNVHVAVPSVNARVRVMFNGNDFGGNLYVDSGMVQIGNGAGGTTNCIPDTADVIMSAGTRMGMGTSDTIGALIGGAADPANSLAAALVNPNTSATSPSLTVGAGNRSGVYDGDTANETGPHLFSFLKTGSGTQTLNGTCAHSGTTTISGGKLMVNGSYASGITVSGGTTLAGTGTSTAAITATSATNGGANVAPGNPTGTLSALSANLNPGGNLLITLAGAQNSKLSVSGFLNITGADLVVSGSGTGSVYVIASYGSLTGTFATVPAGYTVNYTYNDGITSNNIAVIPPSDAYAAWAASKGLTAANNAKDADPDLDGVANGLEFYLDGNPLSGDAPGMSASVANGELVLTWKRRDDAESLNIVPQSSTTLASAGWSTLQDGVNGVIITVSENTDAPDDVQIRIPASGSRLYARLLLTLP